MIQCYKEHTDAQMQVMKDAADKLIDDHLIPTGRVPYEAVVAAGILPGKTSENRDLFCPMRQFPHMFTHQDSVDRLAEYRRVHSAEYIEAQRVAKAQENGLTKELKQAETVLRQDTVRVQKAALTALAKNQKAKDKAEEKTAFELLSKDEQKAVRATKKLEADHAKVANAEKRKAADDARAENVAKARRILDQEL